MNFEFCTCTDPGLVRENNEDSVAVRDTVRLAILADGMGGYNAGEVASGMATAFIEAGLGRWLSEAGPTASPRDVRRAMEICVGDANRSIFDAANANPEYSGMGTTLVVGVFHDSKLILGHIGDSRCYRLRNGAMAQITKDHSLLQEQLDAGLITRQQAATSLNKNLVTRALGVENAVLLEINEHRVEPGDIYLMCSDGLSDMVDDEDIASILGQGEPLERRASLLVDAANAKGGRDNITVLLARADPRSEKRGLLQRFFRK